MGGASILDKIAQSEYGYKVRYLFWCSGFYLLILSQSRLKGLKERKETTAIRFFSDYQFIYCKIRTRPIKWFLFFHQHT